MTKSETINADLTRLGIPFDPDDHWKTREKLLLEAQETLGAPVAIEPTLPARRPDPVPSTDGEPPQNPMQGDKTPAVVEWRRANWTEKDFRACYGGRRIGGEICPK